MGTSVNQRSPETDNWRIVQEIYENPEIPIPEALRLLWRAASNRNEANLVSLLSSPQMSVFSDFAATAASPAEAAREMTRYISENKVATLATDIAKRAVMQSVGQPNASQFFVQRLFAEATSYLVSRDLPGYVGPSGRFQSVSEAQGFTREMTRGAAEAVSATTPVRQPNSEDWPKFVTLAVNRLRRRR